MNQRSSSVSLSNDEICLKTYVKSQDLWEDISKHNPIASLEENSAWWAMPH